MLDSNSYTYADLHVHTNYSDNRDHASLEQIVQQGSKLGISCFGTGDHNHNLTNKSWEAQQEETRKLKQKYPQYQLLNNCELTFRFGHALLLSPDTITGTIEEAYTHLFSPSETMLIINHPYITSDRWKGSIIPHAGGVEVINGAVYSHGDAEEYRERISKPDTPYSVKHFPHVACYADYLEKGIPVLPFGNSDAHSLDEIGIGVTGFWGGSLGEAIERGNVFAATDTNIRMYWELDPHTDTLSFEATVDPSPYMNCSEDIHQEIELYQGNTYIASQSDYAGTFFLAATGYYWFAVRRGDRFAVSAPIYTGKRKPRRGMYHFPLDIHRKLFFHRSELSNSPRIAVKQHNIAAFDGHLYGSESAMILDSGGTRVGSVQREAERDVVIDKTGDVKQLYEFFPWFGRNEIHEYKFARLNYELKKEGTLWLMAVLLPALYLPDGYNDEEVRKVGEDLSSQLESIVRVELFVEIPPLYHARLDIGEVLNDLQFPLLIEDAELGIHSQILFPKKGKTWYQYITKVDRMPK